MPLEHFSITVDRYPEEQRESIREYIEQEFVCVKADVRPSYVILEFEKKEETAVKCLEPTEDGTPCQNTTTHSSGHCHQHRD